MVEIPQEIEGDEKAKLQAHATHEGNGLLMWLRCVRYCVNSCITLHNQPFRLLDPIELSPLRYCKGSKASKVFITNVRR